MGLYNDTLPLQPVDYEDCEFVPEYVIDKDGKWILEKRPVIKISPYDKSLWSDEDGWYKNDDGEWERCQ